MSLADGYPPTGNATPADGAGSGRRTTKLLIGILLALIVVCSLGSLGYVLYHRSQDPLAGRWSDGHGTVYEFKSSGGGKLHGEVVQNTGYVCAPVNIRVSGTKRHYTGAEAFYSTPCPAGAKPIGDGAITIDVAADHATAKVRWQAPHTVACSNCAALTWTRVKS